MKDDEFSCILDNLYAAATGDTSWDQALLVLDRTIGSCGIGLHRISTRDARIENFLFAGIDPEVMKQYGGRWVESDPRAALAAQMPEGEIICDAEVIDEAAMDESPFWAEFLTPFGLRYGLTAIARRDRYAVTTFTAQFPHGSDAPGAEPRRWIHRCMPHLRRAVDLSHLLQGRLEREHNLIDALDLIARPILLVGENCKLIHANAAGERALGQRFGIACRHGRLQLEAGANADFEASLRRIKGGETADIYRFCCPKEHGSAVVFTVIALPFDRAHAVGALALVTIDDPDRQTLLDPQIMQSLYGMTRSEARLARALAGGESLKEYAARERVCYDTARSHLQRAMHKMDVRRQSDLVARALKLASAVGRPEPL